MKARPRSIIWFERAAVLNLIINALWLYPKLFSSGAMLDPLLRPLLLSTTAFTIIAVITLLLIWLVARRGNRLAKWLYVSLQVARIAATFIIPPVVQHAWPTLNLIGWVQVILTAASVWLLFRRDARDWLGGRRPVDPGIFE